MEEIDGKEREIGVRLGVIANVEVTHLLEDDVGSCGAHHHLTEERGNVDSDGHVGDHLLEEIPLCVVCAWSSAASELPELNLQIGDLAFP